MITDYLWSRRRHSRRQIYIVGLVLDSPNYRRFFSAFSSPTCNQNLRWFYKLKSKSQSHCIALFSVFYPGFCSQLDVRVSSEGLLCQLSTGIINQRGASHSRRLWMPELVISGIRLLAKHHNEYYIIIFQNSKALPMSCPTLSISISLNLARQSSSSRHLPC